MTDRRGTWGEALEDAYIRDGEGCVWRVCVIDDDGYRRCKNMRGELLTIAPKDPASPVTLVSHDDPGAAIALIRDTLGARIEALKSADSPVWTVEPWPPVGEVSGKLDAYRDHLFHFHGMYAKEIKGYKKLNAAHDAAHDPEQPNVGRSMTPHVHPAGGDQ